MGGGSYRSLRTKVNGVFDGDAEAPREGTGDPTLIAYVRRCLQGAAYFASPTAFL